MTYRKGFRYIGMVTIALLLLAGNFTGCEPEDWIIDVDCGECFGHKPDSAALIVYLTINEENLAVPLTFYRGEAYGEVDWLDTATTPEHYPDAAIGVEYTVKAEYRSGGKHVIAFDADRMKMADYRG